MNPLATGWIETLVKMLGAMMFFARAAVRAGRPFSLARTGFVNRVESRFRRCAGTERNSRARVQRRNHSELSAILSL